MTKYEDSGLKPQILQALRELGFENMTPIQEKSIPHLIQSKQDLIAFAQTGTGKTAAFSLPIIEQIDLDNKNVQSLILCPTRELCIQIKNDIQKFTKHLKGVSVAAVYGGERIDIQMRNLRQKPQIVVGTPGRTLDLINRKKLKVQAIRFLVLDEADEMLHMGFKDDLDDILSGMPEERQSLLFSATMAKNVRAIANKYMKKALEINVQRETEKNADISHEYYITHASDRYEVLRRIADLNPDIYGIIFCRTKIETKEVAHKLMNDRYSADAIHGDLSQKERDVVMNRFRKKQIQLLVATDVAARGIDVNDLTHVINYSLPESAEVYVHRTGRTGRAGKKGIAVSILNMRENRKIRDIERRSKKKFEQKQIPLGKDVCKKQLLHMIDKVSAIKTDKEQIAPFLDIAYKKLENLSREELIQFFLSVEFKHFLDLYKDSKDLNVNIKKDRNIRDRRNPKERRHGVSFSKFKLEIGGRDRLNKRDLMSLINKNRELKGAPIGRMEILKDCTYVEIDKKFEKAFLNTFVKGRFRGAPISARLMKTKRR